MATRYKGQGRMLCPYYIRETKLAVVCEIDGECWIRFGDPESKYKYRDHHCAKAVPFNCPRYNEHRRRVELGEEEIKRPRQSMDHKWKDYHTAWVRERRKDPTYKY